MQPHANDEAVVDFLKGGGETGALIRARDWSDTPLGPIESWAPSLRTALSIVLHSPVPMVMLWGVDGVMLYNDAYSVFAVERHPGILGSKVREGWPEVADFNDNIMRVCLAGGALSYRNQELILHRKGAPERVSMNLDYSPVYDETGRPGGVIAIVVETTDQLRAERELKAERDRATGVLDGMADGFLLLGRDFTILEINAEGLRIDGRPRDAFIGKNHWQVWPNTKGTALGEAYERAMRDRTPFVIQNRYAWLDGRAAWLEVRGSPVEEGLALFYRDVTEAKRAEEHLRLMVDELNHRVKNSLAIVQAIVSQTLHGAAATPELRHALSLRLRALAKAHDVLTQEKWSGASLKDLTAQAAAPYGAARFEIDGPPVMVPPRTAIAFALAFHELATNAAKYGALSTPDGRIDIAWRKEDGRLILCWREQGGPMVQQPERLGFGTKLIQRSLANELAGSVNITYAPDGLACEIEGALPAIDPDDALSSYLARRS